jgi:hypothetical protein
MESHKRLSPWHELMVSVEFFEYSNREEALAAELAEITLHCPPFNVAGNPEHMVPIMELKSLTVRIGLPLWQAMRVMTSKERTSIQAYTMQLYQEDFARRGLSWTE